MGGHIGTYDARKVTTTANGFIVTGYAEDTMVKCSKDNDNFESSSSAQGDAVVAINGEGQGAIVITLNQTSPSIPALNKLANDRTMFPIWVNSNNEIKEVVGGTKAMVTKVPDIEFGKSVSNREYTIKVFDYQVK